MPLDLGTEIELRGVPLADFAVEGGAEPVAGFIGFAVGRTSFWDPLVSWRDDHNKRDASFEEIARRYREWCDVFDRARAGG